MKYQRLSKEQLEELHVEFINFLATQSITAEEWSDIKENKPQVAEEEIDIFSDLVWEKVLTNAQYLEHFSKDQIHLFELLDNEMCLIAVKVNNDAIDITTQEGYQWLQSNLLNDEVVFYNASKQYSDDKNLDKFTLIQKGANITKGELYQYFANMIENRE
ncbi:hypothetical protein IWQ47_002256 [Aquimarina sp. EL_43]|uniref:DUF6495 family protein n=1 Tax=unclassified Aquimarina TaxID=2627091 RepID=UPI0018C9A28B|nr:MULTISPECIES: DUF6495 family protein [unclassified Aquimarina]MBG6130792.1 hypothetical protein [Aquimarina sp. EL_35]MBG6151061.1 hypothetical protein [Aquimarina sp. EL_32]MBG6169182.1 hypothetical protein [Aquimarina sp. EL_43]